MKLSLLTTLLALVCGLANAQIIGEYVQETIPAFGFCIMPDNTHFMSLEADYDGEYITERELIDLFETSRFDYSKELVNWTYYSYWALNERTMQQPTKHVFYKMIADPTGTYIALAPVRGKGWQPTLELLDVSTQTKLFTLDVSQVNPDIDYLNLVRFDTTGTLLYIGANDQGVFTYQLENKEFKTIHPPFTYQLAEFDYQTNEPIYKAFVKMDEDDYVLEKQLFKLKNGTKQAIKLPLPLHYTRIYTPTQTHTYYGLYYEQAYNTYIGYVDEFNYRLLYHNPKTFVFVTREVPIEE